MADPALNIANRTLYHGDNLAFLRGINSGTIHLIATDPPFNKGRDFHATPDSLAAGARFEDRWSWDKDVHQDWVDAIQDDWPAVWQVIEAARAAAGEDMAAFLCWLGVRLLEMHRVLRDDGSLYLHCDPTASHYLKALLDALFGRDQFQNEITWKRTTAHNDAKRYGRIVDHILFYTKGEDWTWNEQYQPYSDDYKARFRRQDPDGRLWSDDNLTAKGLSGGGYEYEYKGAHSLWRVPLKTMEQLDAEGRLHFTNRGGIRRKRYLDELPGLPAQAVWDDIAVLNSQARERLGYPTQKPLALYERIIKASSNEGDFVLDPFCGCATTPVAAERLGRQWVGMDIWDKAHQTVIDRLQKEGLADPDGGTDRLLTFGQIGYSTVPPVRSDDAETAAPILNTKKKRIAEPPGPKMTREEMVAMLIEEDGLLCRGCDREFDDPLYLELDHNTPRSDGGLNHISNRLLLCGPCNRIKSNTLTLSGLRRENTRRGRMADG